VPRSDAVARREPSTVRLSAAKGFSCASISYIPMKRRGTKIASEKMRFTSAPYSSHKEHKNILYFLRANEKFKIVIFVNLKS